MVHRDVFIKEVGIDMNRSWILIAVGIVVIVIFLIVFWYSANSLWSVFKRHNDLNRSLGNAVDVSSDNNVVKKVSIQTLIKESKIPDGATFVDTMRKRAGSSDVKGFNAEVTKICDKRDGTCDVDPGLGGGTAAAFDPSQDSYIDSNRSRSKKHERHEKHEKHERHEKHEKHES